MGSSEDPSLVNNVDEIGLVFVGLRIFLTFGTTRVVVLRTGHPYPRRNPWYSFSEAESTPGHMVPSGATEKIPSDTTGNRPRDLPTSSAVP